MRATLLGSLFLLLAIGAFAQEKPQRRISLKNFGNDSLHIPFNAEYYLIEDSCAQITRHARLNSQQRFFYGSFKDVSHSNPEQVVAEGHYNSAGLKDGTFTSYHLNGNLQSRGNFKEGQLNGEWQLFYASGKPKLAFSASDNGITITDAWDEVGTKTVVNGTGKYQVNLGIVVWKGKLENGKAVGTWIASAPLDRSNKIVATEKFKSGDFVRGTGPIGDYTDESRIMWFNMKELPYLNAEHMAITVVPCNAKARKLIVGAQFRNGLDSYSEEIKRVVSNYLGGVDLKPYEDILNIEGEVSEDGRLVDMRYKNAFNDRIASGLVRVLGRLPLLEPALADGEPVRQKFIISFRFYQGVYSFNYRFLPVNLAAEK